MSNQSEDGWYPECDDCGCGNLSKSITLCDVCLKKLKDKEKRKLKRAIKKAKKEVFDTIASPHMLEYVHTDGKVSFSKKWFLQIKKIHLGKK